MSLFNRVTGRPLIVDEMDEPVLNLGSGDQALTLNEHFAGPRGPVVNVDLAPQPTLAATGTEVRPGDTLLPTLPGPTPPLHMRGDATDLGTLASLSPTGRFREIHAVNPYGFHPHESIGLMQPTGRMHITGQDTNPFAQPTPVRGPRRVRVPDPPQQGLHYSSTPQGQMRAEHASLNHNLTSGRPLDTTRSSTHTLTKK